jgi:hypothetical protein
MKQRRITRVFFLKCDVEMCQNKVYSDGAICQFCLEKLVNPKYDIVFCEHCGKIMNLIEPDFSSDDKSDRFIPSVCSYCNTDFTQLF